jgi:hypothetical protein
LVGAVRGLEAKVDNLREDVCEIRSEGSRVSNFNHNMLRFLVVLEGLRILANLATMFSS